MYLSSTLFVALLLIIATKGEIDEHIYHITNPHASPTVNFNEIFTNSISMLTEEIGQTAAMKDEDFNLHSIPTQLAEFHSPKVETTKMTPPSPIYLLTSSYLTEKESKESTTTEPPTINVTITTTTERNETIKVHVIPIKKNVQRGVLDILFPASRVRTFKGVFDAFRKILSHTFR